MFKKKIFQYSFAFSIILHLIFAILLTIISFKKIDFKSDYTEVTWGPISNSFTSEMSIAELESGNPIEGETQNALAIDGSLVELPIVKSVGSDEKFFSSKEKIKNEEIIKFSETATSKKTIENVPTTSLKTSDGKKSVQIGEKNEISENELKKIGKGSVSFGDGKNLSYDIEWSNKNLSRNLEIFQLPKYPKNLNVETQIRVKLFIEPSGFVSDAIVLQKGNTQLENISLKEVKKWKFEALQSGHSQQTQSCIVTFKFILK